MSQNDEYIQLVTSSPELKKKIHININSSTDVVYWYIKFNIPLDADSVSKKTMGVTDTEGYILDTAIMYNQKSHMIVINPLEPYVQNEFYILSISKKVRSENFQNLKRDIHILFKLKNNVISEFKILPPNVKVPKPKKRPPEQKATNSKVYSFDKYINGQDAPRDFLPSASIMINPIIGGLGLIATIAGLVLMNSIVIIAGIAVVLLGLVHIFKQIFNKKFRSNFVYNKGIRNFNKERYFTAKRCFEKALLLNPDNEYAEYANNKISYYL